MFNPQGNKLSSVQQLGRSKGDFFHVKLITPKTVHKEIMYRALQTSTKYSVVIKWNKKLVWLLQATQTIRYNYTLLNWLNL